MMIKYRWLATLMIGFLWTLTAVIVTNRVAYMDNFGMFMTGLIGFTVASVITHMILSALLEGQAHDRGSEVRQRKVEKLMRYLDDEDLDLLRDRLTYDERESSGTDGEYDSLDSLLNHQKQKR